MGDLRGLFRYRAACLVQSVLYALCLRLYARLSVLDAHSVTLNARSTNGHESAD